MYGIYTYSGVVPVVNVGIHPGPVQGFKECLGDMKFNEYAYTDPFCGKFQSRRLEDLETAMIDSGPRFES